MKWIKSGAIGALAALVMFLGITLIIKTGVAPFNLPPSAAFLMKIGLPAQPLGLVVHFVYGMFWSVVLITLFKGETDVRKGIGLALVLWLVMMVVFSPIIGWGFFGFGGAGHQLSPDDPLYLGMAIKYLIGTLILHLVYGAIIGWLNPVWIRLKE